MATSALDLSTLSVNIVRIELADIHGIARSHLVAANHFSKYAEKGIKMPAAYLSCSTLAETVEGTGLAEEISYGDCIYITDLSTFHQVPWHQGFARVISEPYYLHNGKPIIGGSRHIAKRALAALDNMGLEILSGYSYEFRMLDASSKQPIITGSQGCSTLRNLFNVNFITDIFSHCKKIGIDVVDAHCKSGSGHFSISFSPSFGIESADNGFTFKNCLKEMSQFHNTLISFMSKPFIDEERNGGHFNHSLWQKSVSNPNDLNAKRIKRSAFFDINTQKLSEIGRHWLAGLLFHAPALTAIGQPTINCYKRAVSYEPKEPIWGYENRTAFVRLSGTTDDTIHFESRSPAGCANPYLVLAAHIAAGIDGIKRKLEPPNQVQVAFGKNETPSAKLPQTLEEGLEAVRQDTAIIELMGSEFLKIWQAVKLHEIAQAKLFIEDYGTPQFYNRIDAWEWKHYFEFL